MKRIVDEVKEDLEAQAVKGEQHYGQHLMPDALVDGLREAYEESLDMANYLKLAQHQLQRLRIYNTRLRAQRDEYESRHRDAIKAWDAERLALLRAAQTMKADDLAVHIITQYAGEEP